MYNSSRTVTGGDGGGGGGDPGSTRSPRLPRSPRLGHRRTNSSGGSGAAAGGSGKTMSMENIQSLNAAYAASGPLYLGEYDGPGGVAGISAAGLPKSTMTLGRPMGAPVSSVPRPAPYGLRMTAMGSSPNIASAGLPGGDAIIFGENDLAYSMGAQVPASLRGVRECSMLELQAQLKEMQRANELLRRELEVKESKLGSSMSSIKTFWSPELKKERAIRKEEASRMTVIKEQMRVMQEETQHLQLTIQALQEELRTQRDLNQLFQQQDSNYPSDDKAAGDGADGRTEPSQAEFHRLRVQHDRQSKELFLLRRTLEEMELRIDTQKQTLGARDESIRKLLEMLQGKGPGGRGGTTGDDERLADAEAQLSHIQGLLEGRERENQHLREELQRRGDGPSEPGKTKALQTVVEMKDTKIASLERNLRDLEDEVQMLKTNGALSIEEREEELKQMEVYKSHSKFMKNKVERMKEDLAVKEVELHELRKRVESIHSDPGSAVDQLKQEISRKDSELLAVQTKLETLTNQNSDCKQHIEVLKESLTAKEQRAAILQTEVDALRMRLEEKESLLNKKGKQLQELTEEKGTLAGEIRDLKDMLDVKERKINVLQKKIENLQEQLRDKEKQVGSLKDRIKSLQADSSNTDTALATLEEALSEKERIIERLKEQRERDDRERQEEVEAYKKENKDLKEKVNTVQAELSEKESSLLDLKEHASSLASAGLKKDSKLKSLEITLEQRTEECSKLESHLRKSQVAEEEARTSPELTDRIRQLEKELSQNRSEVAKSQAEVDRLLEILKEVENEKHDKDKKIAELENSTPRGLKDHTKKMASLKHKEQMEKKKSAQLLEEARKREDNLSDSSHVLQDTMRQKDDRIEELEEALRESVQITAEREMVLAQEESARAAFEKQLQDTGGVLEKTRQELDSTKAKLSSMQQSLAEKEAHLTNLRAERRRQLEEVLEMKQEALLAAISEKDANIALLELSASKKKKTQDEVAALKREKDRLVQQLKQQTQNRMKLMADNYEDDHHYHRHHHPGKSQNTNHRPSPDQMIESLLEVRTNRGRLMLYIEHLTELCRERDGAILEGFPALPGVGSTGDGGNGETRAQEGEEEDGDGVVTEERLRALSPDELQGELERTEQGAASLQVYADSLLQQISDRCPELLEQVVTALEEAAS
uniref:ELKS/Rab6-interacting/CAST family member 1-like isoform X2 n=1 Tax=Petromyzon marinus TaxID=7757 RepID=A0AAJ7TTN1_PETMA|nr:ELKS/Rab6-interacting/CAST family member 1-like isoform X2 [Petromyzon marinus]